MLTSDRRPKTTTGRLPRRPADLATLARRADVLSAFLADRGIRDLALAAEHIAEELRAVRP